MHLNVESGESGVCECVLLSRAILVIRARCVCAVSSCEVRGERGVLVGRDRDAGVRGEREEQYGRPSTMCVILCVRTVICDVCERAGTWCSCDYPNKPKSCARDGETRQP